ncbi:MAG: ABC transporter substrate-binding protein, partial [Pseudomonadota bacterium]
LHARWERARPEYLPFTVTADDWCPQHCQANPRHKGYIVDIVGQALQSEGVPYTIVYRPWLRALRQTELGQFDGLLTPTVKGYPQFSYPQEAVGYQQYCFYVNADSPWTYKTPADLLGKRVAHLKESGFGELDAYMAANKKTISVLEFAGNQGLTTRIFRFLAAGRADTVIMTSDVYDMSRRMGESDGSFKRAGCLPTEKLAVGLSKADPERARWIAARLDSGIARLRQSGRLKAILAEYGMTEWPVARR